MSGWNSIRRALGAPCAVLVLSLPLTACRTPLERAYGNSQRAHVAQSIEDPEAGLRNRDVPHPDGTSADIATTKMRTVEKKIDEVESENLVDAGE